MAAIVEHSNRDGFFYKPIESLDCRNLYSESAALNYAAATGLLSEVLGEACELTVSGRMSSRDFYFVIRQAQDPAHLIPIHVRNAQIEIDGGYEGQANLALIEAKNTKCEDFLMVGCTTPTAHGPTVSANRSYLYS